MVGEDKVIDKMVRISDEEIERIMNIFHKRSDKIAGISWQEKLVTLNKCKCCPKHQFNRPTKLVVWYELPTNLNKFIICNCDCRHMARMICRTQCGSVDNN